MQPWEGTLVFIRDEIPGEGGRPAVNKSTDYFFGYGLESHSLQDVAEFFEVEVEDCPNTKAHVVRAGAPEAVPVPVQISMLNRMLHTDAVPRMRGLRSLVSKNELGMNQINVVDVTKVRRFRPF